MPLPPARGENTYLVRVRSAFAFIISWEQIDEPTVSGTSGWGRVESTSGLNQCLHLSLCVLEEKHQQSKWPEMHFLSLSLSLPLYSGCFHYHDHGHQQNKDPSHNPLVMTERINFPNDLAMSVAHWANGPSAKHCMNHLHLHLTAPEAGVRLNQLAVSMKTQKSNVSFFSTWAALFPWCFINCASSFLRHQHSLQTAHEKGLLCSTANTSVDGD